MRAFNLIGNEETLTNITTSASTIGSAILVRLLHPNTTNSNVVVVYRLNASGTLIGSFSMDHSGPEYVFKDPGDKIYCSAANEVVAAPVTFMY